MRRFVIAGVQMYVSAQGSNTPRMIEKIDQAVQMFPHINMILFSELAAYGPSIHNAKDYEDLELTLFKERAKKHKIWIIPGSFFVKDGEQIYNSTYVIDPSGEVTQNYQKMFPFTPYEQHITPGSKFVVFDVPNVGKFGISICYDMWIPETIRELVSLGAEVILHPSLTGTIDRKLELTMVQATAIQNQCYIFDINGLGYGGVGESIVCDPHGRVLHQSNNNEIIIPIEIDLDNVTNSRENGVLGLGQPLKSFRDSTVHFSIYDKKTKKSPAFEWLGSLEKPKKNISCLEKNITPPDGSEISS